MLTIHIESAPIEVSIATPVNRPCHVSGDRGHREIVRERERGREKRGVAAKGANLRTRPRAQTNRPNHELTALSCGVALGNEMPGVVVGREDERGIDHRNHDAHPIAIEPAPQRNREDRGQRNPTRSAS